jgi:hypothetical protein
VKRIRNLESGIGGGSALILLLLAACGRKPEAPRGETEEWRAWRQTQIAIPAAGFAPAIQGRLVVQPPTARAKHPDDFCEVFLNGTKLNRFRVGPMAGGAWPQCEMAVTLREGPNWIDLWDSTSNRKCREMVDTRSGADLTFAPTAEGYVLQQSRRE